MRRIVCFLCCCFFFILNGRAQDDKTFNFQSELNTDNDAFIIWENFDRYYTYGAGFKQKFKAKKLLGLEQLFKKKKFVFYSLGFRTEGYTPTRDDYSEIELDEDGFNFERPFAGLLFATFDASYLFEDAFIRTEVYLGIMGPSAYSREIQDWIHENITDDDLIDGWDFQIPDQPIINFNIYATQTLYEYQGWFDLYLQGTLRLGNLYMDATPGLGFRLGIFESVTSSNAFGNGLVASPTTRALFFRSHFSATAVAFNGTAQGRLINNDFEFAIDDLSHFHTSMSHGLFYTGRRFAASFDHIFTFGKVNKKVRHIYGRFTFQYRF
jgi:hypothetical protein